MSSRPQLVLDIGGVLLSDLRPGFWQTVASRWGVRNLEDEFIRQYKAGFWTGEVPPDDLFRWIRDRAGVIDREALSLEVERSLTPLPALGQLGLWAERADLHLLSNHRTAWVNKALGSALPLFRTATISDTAGLCKPDPRIFETVHRQLPAAAPVVYIDDHEKNLTVARTLGWKTLLADPEGRWMETAETFLDTP